MITLSMLLAVILTVVVVRVKRMVWGQDYVIPLMLIMLTCSMYSLALFFFFNNIIAISFA